MKTSTNRQHLRSGAPKPSTCVGIWRLMECFHRGQWTDLHYAQPAEASGSPRADYVVKMVTERADSQVEGQMQIRAEAAGCEAVRHPNLIALLDARLSAPRPYIVMPRLEGSPLSVWMGSTFSQPLPVCLWWIRQAAQATLVLHEINWIHGDIKPDNLMISPRGHLTVIDLGLSQRGGIMTDPHRYQGTPEYSAPELFDGRTAATTNVDVYSLGVVFYQLLSRTRSTGSPQPVDVSKLCESGVPDSVIELIMRMLAERPTDRVSTKELVAELFRLEIETLGVYIQPDDARRSQAA